MFALNEKTTSIKQKNDEGKNNLSRKHWKRKEMKQEI